MKSELNEEERDGVIKAFRLSNLNLSVKEYEVLVKLISRLRYERDGNERLESTRVG